MFIVHTFKIFIYLYIRNHMYSISSKHLPNSPWPKHRTCFTFVTAVWNTGRPKWPTFPWIHGRRSHRHSALLGSWRRRRRILAQRRKGRRLKRWTTETFEGEKNAGGTKKMNTFEGEIHFIQENFGKIESQGTKINSPQHKMLVKSI